MTEDERRRVMAIRTTVKAHTEELFARHPWLRHQDAIGLSIMLFALSGSVALAVAYARSAVPAWLCIVGIALFGSLLHELEHDLLHDLYFRENRHVQNAMMLLCWLARPNLMNPWARKYIHRHHHRVSGTRTDVEEIAATNGMPMGPRRLLMMSCRTVRVLLSKSRTKAMVIDGVTIRHSWRDLPETIFDWLLLAWLARCVLRAAGVSLPGWLGAAGAALDFVAVVLVLPNLLRRYCLFFITSNNHYHGDVRNLLQQTQVLNHWIFLPLNLFCFNFGSTHAIHHFVVRQPFYVRQWIAPTAHRVLKENGVRFNDLGTFARANRYGVAA